MTFSLVMDCEKMVGPDFEKGLASLKAVAEAAGGSLDDVVRFTVYLTDLKHFAKVNEIMATYVAEPYPARAAIGVASLPRDALVEVDAVMVLEA